MNPYAILAAVVVAGAALVGSYVQGRADGRDACQAQEARDEAIRKETRELAQKGAAEAIAANRPRNVTIRQETEREIRTNTVYSECRHSPGQLQRINSALTGRTEPASGGELPASGPSE